MANRQKEKITIRIADEAQFRNVYREDYPKLLLIDLHPSWVGPCDVMYNLYVQLAASIDDFRNRVDVLLVEHEKIPSFHDELKAVSSCRPKFLLAIHGKIIHTVSGPDLPLLEELVRK
jgi:hypothetical protein